MSELATTIARGWQFKHHRQYDQAKTLCDRLLEEAPDYSEALLLSALVQWETGNPANALTLLRRAITSQPDHSMLYNAAGVILNDMQRHPEATAYLEKAINLTPDYHEARCNLGLALYHQRNYSQAAQCFEYVVNQCPQHEVALANLGMVLLAQGAASQAAASYESALAVNSKQPHWWGNLGAAYAALNQFSKAVFCFRNAMALDNQNIDFYINSGIVHRALGDWQSSIEMLLAALALDPEHIEAISHLFVAYQSTCQWHALETLRPILDRHIEQSLKAKRLPCEQPMMLLRRSTNLALNLEVARSWSRYNAGLALRIRKPFEHTRSFRRAERITIGYLSSDFRDHAVGHQLFPLFGLHDRRRFNVLALSTGHDDGSTYRQQIQQSCDEFVDLHGLQIALAAEKIIDHGVGILIDLNGFSHGHRIGIPALRPAPVQVGYLGYLSTTGTDFIDYLIADRIVLPEQHTPCYSEKIIRMPNCYQLVHHCLGTKKERVQKRGDWQLPENTFIFGSFNQAYKISAALFACWCRILERTPGSVLWLCVDNALAEKNLQQTAQQNGIDPNRLIFAQKMPLPVHLERLPLTDLVLDTDTYNGGATTANALSAGVPVLSIMGNHWVSRMTASHLLAAGMPELVASNLEMYEDTAVRLAKSPPTLMALRQKLNIDPRNSPLFNTRAFVRELEKAYEILWQRHVDGLKPDHIDVPPSTCRPNRNHSPIIIQEYAP